MRENRDLRDVSADGLVAFEAGDVAVSGTAAPVRDVRWEKAYAGLPATVSQVRRDVRAVLGPCPAVVADDVELVVSELAGNAIRHSRSGEPGGAYAVRISHLVTEKVPYVWVEVVDQGSSSWDGTLRAEPAHGLAVVRQLSTFTGSDSEPDGQRVVFARLDYSAGGMPLYGTGPVPELPADLSGVRDFDS